VTWRGVASASLNTATERIPWSAAWMTRPPRSHNGWLSERVECHLTHPETRHRKPTRARLRRSKAQPQHGSGIAGSITRRPEQGGRIVRVAMVFRLLDDDALTFFSSELISRDVASTEPPDRAPSPRSSALG